MAGCTSPSVGNWGTNYLLRGMGNLLGPGWNRPQDAVYPLSQKDANGDEYNGADRSYIIRFEKGQLPPAEAFWSLTMYDSNFFFVRAMGGFEKLQEGLKKLKTENPRRNRHGWTRRNLAARCGVSDGFHRRR